MARETMTVGEKIRIEPGRLVISVGFTDLEKKLEMKSQTVESIIQRYEGKTAIVEGLERSIKTRILSVQVSSSIADFKNIFFEIPVNSETEQIEAYDEIKIEV
jgi:hypothetical protein